jgi:hypothetical protein
MSNIPKTIRFYYNRTRERSDYTSVFAVDPEKGNTATTAVKWSGGSDSQYHEFSNEPFSIELLRTERRGYNGKVLKVKIFGKWVVDFRVEDFMESIMYGSSEKGIIPDMMFLKNGSQMCLSSIHSETFKRIQAEELSEKSKPKTYSTPVVGTVYATKTRKFLCISNQSAGCLDFDGLRLVPAPHGSNVFVDYSNITGKYAWIDCKFLKTVSAEETYSVDMEIVKQKLEETCEKMTKSGHLSEVIPALNVAQMFSFKKEIQEKLNMQIRGAR